MFDRKMLLFIMAVILGMASLKSVLPDLIQVYSINFLIFFVSAGGLMVLMHWLGFLEGVDEGFRKGIIKYETVFMFLPHGGME